MCRRRGQISIAALTGLVFAAACQELPSGPPSDLMPQFSQTQVDEVNASLQDMMSAANAELAAMGEEFQVGMVEWIGADLMGQTVFFKDVGNKVLGADFVPNDPRRAGRSPPPGINYIIDQVDAAADALTAAQTTAAIVRAMDTWENVQCSHIPLSRRADVAVDVGVLERINFFGPGLGGSFGIFADIHHAGWLPAGRLPNNVIAATFTAIFIIPGVGPSDIDNNGLIDVAFREIYYNDRFLWQVNTGVDVESIALHEAGHGLSQAHFGKLFRTDSNGMFHFAPRAVMNAGYTGVQQVLAGTDNGGHCSIWSNWPNN